MALSITVKNAAPSIKQSVFSVVMLNISIQSVENLYCYAECCCSEFL
jgi:hypothetical protein